MVILFGLKGFWPHSIMVSIPGFHPGDWSSILHGATVSANPSDLVGVGVVSEKFLTKIF
jgi:hypothetical protein